MITKTMGLRPAGMFLFLAAVLLIVVLAVGSENAKGKTITVDEDGEGDYEKIQDAVDASEDGDTVRVYEGLYEENVVVDKSIDLVGNGSETTTIDGGGGGDVVAVSSDWVNMTGFTITNGGDAGIELNSVQDCTLTNNSCYENQNGIVLDSSSSNRIRRNNLSNNQENGLYLIKDSDKNIIENNICNDQGGNGILFNGGSEVCNENKIWNNTLRSNDGAGFQIYSDSAGNELKNNTISSNQYGIILDRNADNNVIEENTITYNTAHDYPCGIYIAQDSNGNAIKNNTINSNKDGVKFIGTSSSNTITNNTIKDNTGYGIHVDSYQSHWNWVADNWIVSNSNYGIRFSHMQSENNRILRNLFIDNNEGGVQAYDQYDSGNQNDWDVGSEGNYWSDYQKRYPSATHDYQTWNVPYVIDNSQESKAQDNHPLAYQSHDPIRINNDDEFTDENGVPYGSGTANDPYVLPTWNIKGSGHGCGIFIGNTTKHFTIRACYVHNATGNGADYYRNTGVVLYRTTNGTIAQSIISFNGGAGIYMDGSSNATIENNTCSENSVGIHLVSSSRDNAAHFNNITDNTEYGINATDNAGHKIDATGNWWGHATGPYHASKNPDGEGDRVTDNVVFDPWLSLDPRKALYVDDDAPDGGDGSHEHPYNKIQDAIDAAMDGDTIRVWAGTYEENVVVDKTVSLLGDGSEEVTIDGGSEGDVLTIEADWCNLTGFAMINGGGSYTHAGIKARANHVKIHDCNCSNREGSGIVLDYSNQSTLSSINCWKNQDYGIFLRDSLSCTIVDTVCSDNSNEGIYLKDDSNYCSISNTRCSNNNRGIRVSSSDCSLSNVNCSNNEGTGIDLGSYDCTIENSISSNNGLNGISVGSSSTTISNTSCLNNEADGILLNLARTAILYNNTIEGNDRGVGIESWVSTSNSMEECIIAGNRIGIFVHSSCSDNTIHNSSIFDNTEYGIEADEEISATSNWWGHATGPDHSSNPDGEGDKVTWNVDFDPWTRKPPFEDYTSPEATIDSVSPSDTLEGEEVEFVGHGTAYESIDRYVWASDLDGELHNSTSDPDFSTTTLSNGTHEISFKVMDNYGVWSEPVTSILVINGMPEAEILDITPTSALEGEEISFQGKGTDDGTVERYIWTSDLDGELHNSTSDPDFSTTTLSNGSHEIRFKVQDDQGVWSDEDETTITINGRPRAGIVEVSPDPALVGEEVKFKGRGMDDEDIVHYAWTSDLDGELYNDTGDEFETTTLSIGTHSISLKVEDDLGVWSEPVITTLIIHEKPIAVIESISPNPALDTDTILFEGNGTDDGTIEAYKWRIVNETGGEVYNGTAPPAVLPSGTYTIYFKVKDNYGVWSEEVPGSLVVHQRPIASIVSITPNPALDTDTVAFTGVGTDDGKIAQYLWRSSIDGDLRQVSTLDDYPLFIGSGGRLGSSHGEPGELVVEADYDQGPGMRSNKRWVDVGTWTFTPEELNIEVGGAATLKILYSILDEGYGADPEFRLTLTVDGILLVQSTGTIGQDNGDQVTEYTISGNFDTINLPAGVELALQIDYRSWENCIIYLDNPDHESCLVFSEFEMLVGLPYFTASDLSPGTHTITFKVQDNYGVWSDEVTAPLTVNEYVPPANKLPTVTITSPEDGAELKGTVTIKGSASDPDGTVEKVELLVDGEWFLATGTTSWDFQLDTAKLANRDYTINVLAFDGTNYSEDTTLNLTVNNEEEEENGDDDDGFLPGFGAALIPALAVALVLLRRKKKG